MWFFPLTSEKSTVGIYWNNAAETWIDIRSTTADKVIRQNSYSTSCSKSHWFFSLKMKACCFLVGLLVYLWDVQSVSWNPLVLKSVNYWYIQRMSLTHRWCLLNYRVKVTWFTGINVKYCLTIIFNKCQIPDSHQTAYTCRPQSYGFWSSKVTRLRLSPTKNIRPVYLKIGCFFWFVLLTSFG